MKRILLFTLAVMLAFPLAAAAAISGDCSGCHTMHNSQQGATMAMTGIGASTPATSPIANLLRFDCIACHAQNDLKIQNLSGNLIPQVYHEDITGDLAGGNFRHIADAKVSADPNANRKGHNVIDLFPGGDDTVAATYNRPPGFTVTADHNNAFGTGGDFSKFTCAGAAGCHGTRNQLVAAGGAPRTGMAAISGSHHLSVDGKRNPGQNTAIAHSGALVAQGYRFIPGLKGLGNTTVGGEWQNAGPGSHNEYYGDATVLGTACNTCHAGTTSKSATTQLYVPNQSMSGFCATCHGDFHSSAANGSSGAFLRHPSDYVLPTDRGYEVYTAYNVTAPVARNAATFAGMTAPSAVVTPGQDMVMCLSCHVAHASEYDGMLRFDYADMTTGGTSTDGCLACHTNK